MRRLCLIGAMLFLLPLVLPASEFDWMVREFARESGVKPVYIPFFGVVRCVVAIGHPAGARDLRLAVFEHPNLQPDSFDAVTDTIAGADWKPMVRVRSRNGERTNIYSRLSGKDLQLLITTLDNDDAVLVRMRLNPAQLADFLNKHAH